jgi:hypothetical protein
MACMAYQVKQVDGVPRGNLLSMHLSGRVIYDITGTEDKVFSIEMDR